MTDTNTTTAATTTTAPATPTGPELERIDLWAEITRRCRERGSCALVLADEATGLVECQDCGQEHHDPAQAMPELR